MGLPLFDAKFRKLSESYSDIDELEFAISNQQADSIRKLQEMERKHPKLPAGDKRRGTVPYLRMETHRQNIIDNKKNLAKFARLKESIAAKMRARKDAIDKYRDENDGADPPAGF